MTPTIKDLYEFVLKNKTDKTFFGYTDTQIFDMIVDHLNSDKYRLYYAVNDNGEITGMITFEVYHDIRSIFVTENLSMCFSTLRQFAKMAKEMYPGFSLSWLKYGKLKQFNTEKFYRKLKV